VQFVAVAPLIFDQFVIARRCLQRRPAILVCRWVWDLRLNLLDWLHPFIWFVHCGISPNQCQCRAGCISWSHVLKLCLRPLQPLAQALDIFIVRLVLLLVHFQQRPQDFDAMLFLHHTLRVFKLADNSPVSGFRHSWRLVVICCFNCC
jgi:hypothetical protein